MHYYQFNIGDYKSHTDHLDLLEDLAFRRMLDWSYLHEEPLPLDINEIAKKILMRTHTDCIAYVLQEFFVKTEDGYINHRIEKEVNSFKAKSEKARKSAEARWSKKETQSEGNANALRTQSEGNAKHKTLNTKQETLNNNQLKEIEANASCENDKRLSPKQVVDLYNSKMKGLFPRQMRELTENRKSILRARIKNDLKTIEEWSEFFDLLKNSDFLMGRVEPYGGRKVFQLSLDWICKAEHFANIMEGKYHG